MTLPPLPDSADEVIRKFVDEALTWGASDATITKKDNHWFFRAEFEDAFKMAKFQDFLCRVIGGKVEYLDGDEEAHRLLESYMEQQQRVN
jgi:hypothetical protein